MVAVPLIFNPAATATLASMTGAIPGAGGTTVSTSAPPPPSTPTVNVWDVDIPSGCLPDITAVSYFVNKSLVEVYAELHTM